MGLQWWERKKARDVIFMRTLRDIIDLMRKSSKSTKCFKGHDLDASTFSCTKEDNRHSTPSSREGTRRPRMQQLLLHSLRK